MLRRLTQVCMGKCEFLQTLRLLKVFRPEDMLAGIRKASTAERSALTGQAVLKPELLARFESSDVAWTARHHLLRMICAKPLITI